MSDMVTVQLPRDAAEQICWYLDNDPWSGGKSESDLLWVAIRDALDLPALGQMREKTLRHWTGDEAA